MVKLEANINLVDYKGLNPNVRKFLEGRNLTKTSEVNTFKERTLNLAKLKKGICPFFCLKKLEILRKNAKKLHFLHKKLKIGTNYFVF